MSKTYLYQINITRDCNLRCTHCYISSAVKKHSGGMESENFQSIISGISDHMKKINYDHAEIHVIGGEPTMLGLEFFQENIVKARESLENQGFTYELIMVSNLLSNDILPIAKLFDRVNTSWEPVSRFPKPKLEQRWRDYLKLLKDNDIDVGVTTAVTKYVTDMGASAILDHHYSHGIKQIHFGFFIPSGDGLSNLENMFPDFVETSNFLIDSAKWYFDRRDSDPDLFVNPAESMMSAIYSDQPLDDIVCPIIAGAMDIDWNGNAATCLEAGGAMDAKWLGNVFKDGVLGVAEADEFKREVSKAAKPHKSCRTCDEYVVCRSGCGVLAKHWDPDVDEDCPGFKKFIKFMRNEVSNGMKPRYSNYKGKFAF